jgi:phosphate starvation-inducible PhoH-like protein
MTKKRRATLATPPTEPYKIKTIEAKTENQKNYIRAIIENDIVICSGPSGSGKSMIAAGIGSSQLYYGSFDQIVITRPLICSGKDIGALPGDIYDKINPYVMPMQEYFRMFLGNTFYTICTNDKKIRFEPLEIMRGATFNNTYMILDEAQNCTFDQIKMFMTRIGENSKVIINGDIKQNDLRGRSGLETCMQKLQNIEGVGIIELDNSDIQRHGIIGKILNALEN